MIHKGGIQLRRAAHPLACPRYPTPCACARVCALVPVRVRGRTRERARVPQGQGEPHPGHPQRQSARLPLVRVRVCGGVLEIVRQSDKVPACVRAGACAGVLCARGRIRAVSKHGTPRRVCCSVRACVSTCARVLLAGCAGRGAPEGLYPRGERMWQAPARYPKVAELAP